MNPRLFLLSPTVVFQARVNQTAFTYPIAEVMFDGVTTGAYTDIITGMTVLFGTALGLDDLGRQYIRKPPTSDTLYFGRSSLGTHDGEVRLADDAYITVLNDYRVWPKVPTMPLTDGDNVTTYKDADLAVSTYTTDPPPVANIGPGYAATIDPDTSVITVDFDAANSWAVDDGATITGYQWFVYDGTITTGTATDAAITATFPAGVRWVALTVTDSNGETHTARCPVYARDPADDDSIHNFEITRHHITPQGQQLSLRVLEDIAADDYPDGTLVLLWDDDAVTADRAHMQFIGWHHTDPAQIAGERLGIRRDVTLECLDVAGKLDSLPGFPQVIYDDELRDSGTHASITWEYMISPTIKKYLHYLLMWHSTALDVADFRFRGSTTSDSYPFLVLESGGASLFDQVASRAQQLTPDHLLTCTRRGELAVWPDPMLLDANDRTEAFQGEILEDDWSDLRYTHQRPPRVYWLRGGAILSQSTPVYRADGELDIPTVFCVAPGEAPGMGETAQEENERLALSQDALNRVIGHKYARLNAPEGRFSVTLANGDDPGIEPADLEWVWLGLPTTIAAQRGLHFETLAGAITVFQERGLVHSIDIRYQSARTGLLRTITFEWEREIEGPPAVTYLPPVSVTQPGTGLPDDYWDANPGEVEISDPADPFYGNMKAYVLWDGAHVYRTWDIGATSPTWELVDTGITGTIRDGQYVHVSGSTVGMWLLTSTAVWWCADIMATTPAWSAVLPLATVQAADAVPGSTTSVFKCMANYASAPGYAIVATGPAANITDIYNHAYFWHTHNYGANWTQVDMNGYTFSNSGISRGYAHAGPFAMEIFRSSPGTIWCARSTSRVAGQGRTAVFYSDDLGDTWTKGYELLSPTTDIDGPSLLHPFPAATDPSYMMRGDTTGAVDALRLYKSTDGWATGAVMTLPTGYAEISGVWRVNSHTYDPDHIIAWFQNSTDSHHDLLESYDQGATWSFLLDSGMAQASGSRSRYTTPNGWPADENEWVIVRSDASTSALAEIIYRTDDNFSTVQNKAGNLTSLATWTHGYVGGFALPRLGVNT